MQTVLIFLVCVGGAFCFSWPVIHLGACPTFTPVPNINLTAYMGRWYEVEKFPANFEDGMKCIYATYTLEDSSSGPYVRVNNSGIKDGERTEALGKATQPNPPEGAFIVSFDDSPMPVPSKPNYNVISVDTSSYVLIYSCTSFFEFAHLEYAWILAREPTLPSSVIQNLKDVLASIGSDPSDFTVTNQMACDYY